MHEITILHDCKTIFDPFGVLPNMVCGGGRKFGALTLNLSVQTQSNVSNALNIRGIYHYIILWVSAHFGFVCTWPFLSMTLDLGPWSWDRHSTTFKTTLLYHVWFKGINVQWLCHFTITLSIERKFLTLLRLSLKDDFLASNSSLHVLRISSSKMKEETKSLFLENEVETIIKITN